MPAPTPASRIADLRVLLERANRAYYADNDPIMSDREFDSLLRELQDLEREHPELDDPNSPTRRVGGEPIDAFRAVAHALPMLSIDNTYSEPEVREWHTRVLRLLNEDEQHAPALFARNAPWPTFCVDPKIDGVAISLRYERGELLHAVTRGDGRTGDDVTHAIRTIRTLPLRLQAPSVPAFLEVRGEVFIPNDVFLRINERRAHEGLELLMNPRNACAGTLKSLDPKIAAERNLGFIAHGRGQIPPDLAPSHARFIQRLRELNIPAGEHLHVCTTIDDVLNAIREFDRKRHDLPFATDGMVVRVNEYDAQERLGSTAKSPRWAIAYKYPAEQKPTTLLDVEHQVGKSGRITPRAVMDPVLLSGTVVRHATLHNYGQILKKDIRIGDTIEVTKAGEIIPYVLGVILAKRPPDARPIDPPNACPVCGGPIEIEPPDSAQHPELETSRLCVNPECPAQVREKLIWFAARGQMDIEGLGERTIDQIRATSLPSDDPARAALGVPPTTPEIPLAHFADIFALHHHRDALLTLDRMGEKKVDNLLAAIENARSRGLARVLAGMGIRHVGTATARQLARMFSDLDDLLAAPLWRLMPTAVNQMSQDRRQELTGSPAKIPNPQETGLGAITAPIVYAYLHSQPAAETFAALRRAGVSLASRDYSPNADQSLPPTGRLAGKTVVVTGSIEGFTRDELRELLERHGARVTGSVSKNTSLVVAGENPGSKLDAAIALGLEVWNESRLRDELGI